MDKLASQWIKLINTYYINENKIERMERPQVLMENGRPSYLFLALMGGKYKTSTGFVLKINDEK